MLCLRNIRYCGKIRKKEAIRQFFIKEPMSVATQSVISDSILGFGANVYSRLADAAGIGTDAYDAIKTVETTTDAAKAAENIKKLKPSQLTTTHDITMSKRQLEDLVQDIQEKGILEPIKAVKYNGGTYVVDGHHRLHAARQLKLDDVPVQEVNLPYKGYKDINDLLWPY